MAGTNDEAHGSLAGRLLGDRYRVESVIARGGMAIVYRARDESLGRTVAIKIFAVDAEGEDGVRRQRDEIELLASLNHPSLVTLYDAVLAGGGSDGSDGTDAFFIMEFVDGPDLGARIARGPVPPEELAVIAAEVSSALAFVHARGVIHRDIKPGNILLPTPGTSPLHAKLTDFGIARLVDGTRQTAEGSIIGTMAYLSPEQATGDPVGPASDVYSLGLVLLEALTGMRAFSGSPGEALAARLARDPLIPDTVPAEWVSLIRAMTLRSPAARPTAEDVAATLGSWKPISTAETRVLEPTALLAPVEGAIPGHDTDLPPTRVLSYAPSEAPTSAAASAATVAMPAADRAAAPASAPARRRRRAGWIAAVLGAAVIALALTLAAQPQAANSPGTVPTTSQSPTPTITTSPVVDTPTPTFTPTPTPSPSVFTPPGHKKHGKGGGGP